MALFISLEGPDGSGKSTQARLLVEALSRDGLSVTATREPGGTDVGERVRPIILGPAVTEPTPLAMALLYSACRAQLLHEVVLPALGRGDVVVADRYADSTVAYQAYGMGLDVAVVRDLQRIATGGVRPDLSLYVDIQPEISLARTAGRGTPNRLDEKGVEFQRRVRSGYRALMQEEPGRWVLVDGSASPERVHDAILSAVRGRLGKVMSSV